MKLLPALTLAAALLCATPARAQGSAPPPEVNGILLVTTGLPTLTFGILLSTGMFGETPPRNGFVINSIIFGAIGFAYGAILLYMNASQGNEPAGWIAASAAVMCVGAITLSGGLYELITKKRDGTWAPADAPPQPYSPNPSAPPLPDPAGPVPVMPVLAPTRDGHGATFALVGRF